MPNQSSAKLEIVKPAVTSEPAKPKHNRETGEFTLSSGQVVKCRPLAVTAFKELYQKYPPPVAPTQATAVGLVKNEKHSDHIKALAEYRVFFDQKALELALELSVSKKHLEIDFEEVAEIRESMEISGMPINHLSDKIVYLTYILITDPDVLGELYGFVNTLGKPTAQEVAVHIESFPSDLQQEGQ